MVNSNEIQREGKTEKIVLRKMGDVQNGREEGREERRVRREQRGGVEGTEGR